MMKNILLKTLTTTALVILTSCLNNFVLVTGGEDKKGYFDGVASEAKFNYPSALAVDEESGDLYVLDQDYYNSNKNNSKSVIRKITLDCKVSTFLKSQDVDINKKDYSIGTIKIRDGYLYFVFGYQIKRVKLSNNKEVENLIGKEEKGDKLGSLQDAAFQEIIDFSFYPNGNILVADSKFKLVNTQSKTIDLLNYNNSELINKLFVNGRLVSNIKKIEINTSSKDLFVLFDQFIAGRKILNLAYKNNTDSEKISDISKVTTSFVFDNKGNIYLVSLDKEAILKIDTKNSSSVISNLIGVIDIKKDAMFPEMGYEIGILAIDNKRNILYLSNISKNKIFKLKLN